MESDKRSLEEGKFGILLIHREVWENGAHWKVPPSLSKVAWGVE